MNDSANPLVRAAVLRAQMIECLVDAQEFLREHRGYIDQGDEWNEPRPNRAMRLFDEIDTVLREATR